MDNLAIADVATERGLIGGPFGSSLVGTDYVEFGVPVVRGSNMGGPAVSGDFAFVTAAKVAADLSRNMALPGDLVFTQRGTLGQVAMVPAGEFSEYIISQSQMRLRVNEKVANPRFVYFACTAPAFMEQIRENAISTGVPHINLGILSRLTIPWFHLGKQRAIVEVLGALDDKIAVNDGIGRTTDKLLAALFSRLCIGATWGTLNDIAIVNAVVTRPVTDGSLRYVDISSVSVGNYELPPVISWDEAPSRARRVLKAGDTVWSTVRPNRRSHALILDDDASLIASTGLAVLSPNKGRVACVYESTRTAEFVRYLESVAEGSAYPAVRGDRFNDAPVPALCNDKWDRFESMALPLRKRAYAAARETRSLAITRDELLPLLMSGKVCVRDVEKIVEEVV